LDNFEVIAEGLARIRKAMKVASIKLSISASVLLFYLVLGLTPLPALAANIEECCGSDEDSVAKERLESARVLTEDANNLSAMNSLLLKWSLLVANLTKEVPHTDAEEGHVSTTRTENSSEPGNQFKTDTKNFQQLLLAYQDARRAYLQHKMLYDQHVASFHNQPQMVPSIQPSSANQSPPSNRAAAMAPPLMVPPNHSVNIKVEDACAQLMEAEGMLRSTEAQLASVINYLREAKNKLPAEMYFERWTAVQTMGATLQRQVLEYGRVCITKQKNTDAHMQNVEQEANVGGNERQSRDAYVEVQRCSNLNNQETQIAHMHTMCAAQALQIIGLLSPLRQAVAQSIRPGATASGAPGVPGLPGVAVAPGITQYISSDEIEKESDALQAEYDVMQRKYKEAESANPALQSH
jgi:hypothetical protein